MSQLLGFVWVVRTSQDENMKLLLAIDDSKYSEAAAQAVLQQMRPEQSEVCVLHVGQAAPHHSPSLYRPS